MKAPKFKEGDRVVIVSGWFFEELGRVVSGVLFHEHSDHIVLDESTKCRWDYKGTWVRKGDYILEVEYNSPLYQELK